MSKLLAEMTLEELKAKKITLMQQNAMVGLIGSTAGLIYANRTGGGLWRYIGYFIVGGFVVGAVPRLLYFIPKENEVDALIKDKSRVPNSQISNQPLQDTLPSTSNTNMAFDGDIDMNNDLEV